MTAAEWIAERRELLDAATDGPWYDMDGIDWEARVGGGGLEIADTGKVPDAQFIADARTSLPRALTALEAALGMANAGAITSRARGDSEEERRWLDFLITIESALRRES